MWQDISRLAPTEIDAISGAVVRYGRQLKVSTPVNEFLLWLVKNKEQGHRLERRQIERLNLLTCAR